jgi:hypothetical protein
MTGQDPDLVAAVGRRLGAFDLDPLSADSALVADLDPGPYTIHVLDPDGSGGTVLGELYFDTEFGAAAGGRLVNISTRGTITPEGTVVIAGFVIEGDAPRQVLLRAVGRNLLRFDVPDAALQAEIELFKVQTSLGSQLGTFVIPNDDWSSESGPSYIARASRAVGAFDLFSDLYGAPGDSAMLVWLEPGVYSIVVRSVNGSSGTALAEVYDVPFDAPR